MVDLSIVFWDCLPGRVVGFYGDFSDILCQLIILFSNISGIISDIFNEISWQLMGKF